jgi:putative DNA primase/helicase
MPRQDGPGRARKRAKAIPSLNSGTLSSQRLASNDGALLTPFDALASEHRWVAWRNELRGDRLTKVPYGPTGRRAKADDPATWGLRAEAEAMATQLVNGQGGGIGIQLGDLEGDTYLAGIDLDSCLNEDGRLAQWARPILDVMPSYAEVSPSGCGIKLFFYVAGEDVRHFLDCIGAQPEQWGVRRDVPGENARDHGPAVEVYLSHRYFTVTGDKWPGAPDELTLPDAANLERLGALIPPRKPAGSTPGNGADNSRSAVAFRKCAALRRAGRNFEEMCAALRSDPETVDWVQEKGDAFGGRELRRIWDRTAPDLQVALVINERAPYTTAKLFLDHDFRTGDHRTLHHHCGGFYRWTGSAYAEIGEEELRSLLYAALDHAVSMGADRKLRDVKPTAAMVTNVLDALRAAAYLDNAIAPPAWLHPAHDTPAAEIVACSNGLLHLRTLRLFSHTPGFFTLNALDYPFEQGGPEPRQWLAFLDQLWPDDHEAIDTVQEVFGYCLTADTRQQKAFLLIGPKRSGKGTIARVLTHLVGLENTVAPTLAGLAMNFGLAPLIGKRVAIISDARLGGRADQYAIAERLLSITGEDTITVDRKYMSAWTGQLLVRFLVISNELPRLSDSSCALASRFIVLVLTQSFYGREDQTLTARLLTELPGILNWTIAGWRRLTERGHFLQPRSALDAVRQLEDLGSPIGAFLRERCIIGAEHSVGVSRLFAAWEQWCKTQGRDHPGTAQSFGRDLRAAIPGVKVTQPRDGEERSRFYQGLRLN